MSISNQDGLDHQKVMCENCECEYDPDDMLWIDKLDMWFCSKNCFLKYFEVE